MKNKYFDFTKKNLKTYKVILDSNTTLYLLPASIGILDEAQKLGEGSQNIDGMTTLILKILNNNLKRTKIERFIVEEMNITDMKDFIKEYMGFIREVMGDPN